MSDDLPYKVRFLGQGAQRDPVGFKSAEERGWFLDAVWQDRALFGEDLLEEGRDFILEGPAE